MQPRVTVALCALLMLVVSAALAQKPVEVIEQQVVEIDDETLIRMGGELPQAPTPEQEAFGYDPQKILKMSTSALLTAAKEIDGAYTEVVNVIYINDNAIRADLQTPMTKDKISHVIRRDNGNMWIILHGPKKYVEIAANEIDESVLSTEKTVSMLPVMSPTAADEPALTATGERLTINGFSCERYLAKNSGGLQEVWIATGLDDLRRALDELATTFIGTDSDDGDEPWMKVPHGLPILTRELTPGSGLHLEEIKNIKRQPMPAPLFEIPAGYKRISMKEMMEMQFHQDE